MSKYNHMKSISFSELTEGEIEQAIREWSQGNIYMEKLLCACRENKIETLGCHPLGKPYLQLAVNDSQNKIRRMLNAAQNVTGSKITVNPDGGNPISGEKTWYIPTITIGFDTCNRRKIEESLNRLYESIVIEEQDKPKNEIFAHMLDFLDFFAEKESGFVFYMQHNELGEYEFDISNRGNGTDGTYYENLFRRASIGLRDKEWSIKDTDETAFEEKMKKVQKTIFEEYSLEIPQEIKPNMNLTIVARIMRRQFGDTEEGRQAFSKWLKDLERRMHLWEEGKITHEECFTWKTETNKKNEKAIEEYER